jgi:ATP-dependent exoDNAse (exonuclease V) alpha subunit
VAGLVGTDELDIAATVASTRLKAHLPGGHFFGRRTSQNTVTAKFAEFTMYEIQAL